MEYKLLGNNTKQNYLNEILQNRKISVDYNKYLYTTDSDINDYRLLDNIEAACALLHKHIEAKDSILLLVDCDVDGITSSATLWNFIKKELDKNADLHFVVHEGKQHGLKDTVELIEQKNCKLVITADAGSNDFDEHKELHEHGADILALDHHECDRYSDYAIIVNNQMSKRYPNKMLSGAGIVWQFLRCYNDMFLNGKTDMVNYLDLVALGNTADQMSLTDLETKHIIHKGFCTLRNQMMVDLCSAQAFSMKNNVSAMSVAWYVAPMLNSVCRVGTIDEKKDLFRAFLDENKWLEVPSTKRNHLEGDTEAFTEQQVRIAQNIRNRQNKTVEDKMTMIETLIKTYDLTKHKLLLIAVPDNMLPEEIVGLVANKIASKYKQPTLILREITDDKGHWLKGSIRNFGNSPVDDFRKELEDSGLAVYAQGHASAAGLCIDFNNKEKLLEYFDEKWCDINFSPCYFVDFVFDYNIDGDEIPDVINAISSLNKYNLWGQDMPEPMVVVKNLPMGVCSLIGKLKNTAKIVYPEFEVMQFKITEEKYNKLISSNRIDIIATCSENVWAGRSTPQLIIQDYSPSTTIIEGWNAF